MPYTGLKNRTRERFNEVQIFLNYLSTQEPLDSIEPVSLEIKVMKGLFYVHLYAAFEKSINDVVETALSYISSKKVKNNHFQPQLLSIALSGQIQSLNSISSVKLINKSVNLFVDAASTKVASINETVLSANLQNIWVQTIEDVFNSLGITTFELTKNEQIVINEIVDKRNAVAHGRDSAASVGERFRIPALRERMETISTVIYKVIDSTELHCAEKNYIKTTFRRHYA